MNRDDSEKILFGINYDMLIKTIYERSIKETEGLIYTDKVYMQKQDKVISFVLKKMGSNLIKGKSIMNVSLPIDIFDKRSLLQL
jgi:hypothetical protein